MMSENILDTLDGFVRPLEKFLGDFEAKSSLKESKIESKQYENTIKKIFANKFTNDLILKISQIK